jgi:hypothetical protein
MTRWDDMTDLEQAAVLYSDAHKAAYGFRPRNGGVHNPVTLADYDAAFASMQETIDENEATEAAFEARALARFEAEIAALMADHQIDRPTALRWWFEAEGYEPFDFGDGAGPVDSHQDAEHVLWKRGIAIRDWPPIVDAFLPRPWLKAA